jgi:predicted NAD/FAD-binding protein
LSSFVNFHDLFSKFFVTQTRSVVIQSFHYLSGLFQASRKNMERMVEAVAESDWMNLLQSIKAPVDFCVTLNSPEAIAPGSIIRRLIYHHPVYSTAAFEAQKRREEISGSNRSSYCGAYWSWGFHEDGVKSALVVCSQFGRGL